MTRYRRHHLAALHDNWKFGRPQARTSRQAYGHDVEFDGHRKADSIVFWLCMLAGLTVILVEVLA